MFGPGTLLGWGSSLQSSNSQCFQGKRFSRALCCDLHHSQGARCTHPPTNDIILNCRETRVASEGGNSPSSALSRKQIIIKVHCSKKKKKKKTGSLLLKYPSQLIVRIGLRNTDAFSHKLPIQNISSRKNSQLSLDSNQHSSAPRGHRTLAFPCHSRTDKTQTAASISFAFSFQCPSTRLGILNPRCRLLAQLLKMLTRVRP